MENKNKTEEQISRSEMEEKAALEEAKRVKVLSPTMLVVKRFLRNRLAITGLAILIFMFIFSFIGGMFSPYTVSKVFKETQRIKKDYATAMYNKDLRYVMKEGVELSAAAKTQFVLALATSEDTFQDGDISYRYVKEGDDLYRIVLLEQKAAYSNLAGTYHLVDDAFALTPEMKTAFEAARTAKESSFSADGQRYFIQKEAKDTYICETQNVGLATKDICDSLDPAYDEIMKDFDFRLAAELAVNSDKTSFDADGETYEVSVVSNVTTDGQTIRSGEILQDGAPIVSVSKIVMQPKANDVILSTAFKEETRNQIAKGESTFKYTVNENGEDVQYFANTVNGNIYIKHMKESELVNTYESPSKTHLLGTDGNGMDLMTRLMYGGRISLMVGFVVIFIEIVLGVIVGGVAGFFGGWVDMALMRFVDLFNSIPYWPMIIIAGAVMDALKLNSTLRLFSLMFILGFLSWTGIARIVRGQILTLREQEFMVACEANGIRTSRRIFKHLVPNVMPLLIIQATMGLGDVIITEATLSYLGLGVKYPMASWGSIINAATDMFIMTNFWFVWIPAGFCILLTVLGFNFVGDGLRDAFDPKMKR